MKLFSGRAAFVTGGASGIGQAMAHSFLQLGMRVVIVDFNPDYLREAQQTLGGRKDVQVVQADVGDRDQLRHAADQAVRAFGKIHVLCNNAGIGGGGNAEDPDFDGWDRALRVNLGGVVNGVKIVTPLILSHGEGGHIVNTSSMAGVVPLPSPGWAPIRPRSSRCAGSPSRCACPWRRRGSASRASFQGAHGLASSKRARAMKLAGPPRAR